MKFDDIIALARVLDNEHRFAPPMQCRDLARAVLALLTAEKPCGYDAADVANVDSDGYVTVFNQHSMRADDAHWAAVEVLRAVELAKEQNNG